MVLHAMHGVISLPDVTSCDKDMYKMLKIGNWSMIYLRH